MRFITTRVLRQSASVSAAAFSPEAFVEQARVEMARRPPKVLFDVLSPTSSHLLNISLADHIPQPCWPAHFDARDLRLPQTTKSTASSSGSSVGPVTMPQGHHLVYFPPQMLPSQLLPDGTDPAHSPGGPYERRMWAGGSVRFAPDWASRLALDGRRAVCVESVGAPVLKAGGGGGGSEKVFVDVWRRYGAVDGGDEAAAVEAATASPVVEERRSLVFMRLPGEQKQPRSPPSATDAAPHGRRIVKSPHQAEFSIDLVPDNKLLFHFSALTFNAHAIHLDPEFCRTQEGHKTILVHGPLSLALMFSALRAQLDPASEYVSDIEYRNIAPLYAGEAMRVCLRQNTNGVAGRNGEGNRKWDVWVEGPEGGLSVKATAITSRSR